jgi:hypothetical protein
MMTYSCFVISERSQHKGGVRSSHGKRLLKEEERKEEELRSKGRIMCVEVALSRGYVKGKERGKGKVNRAVWQELPHINTHAHHQTLQSEFFGKG